jgi:hypothetical protein
MKDIFLDSIFGMFRNISMADLYKGYDEDVSFLEARGFVQETSQIANNPNIKVRKKHQFIQQLRKRSLHKLC